MMDEFVININDEEGKKYVNLIRDGEEVDWAKTLRENDAAASASGRKDADEEIEEGEDVEDSDRKSTSALASAADETDAKVTSTSELDKREDDVTRADVEEMLQRVVNPRVMSGVGGAGGDTNLAASNDNSDRGGSHGRNSTQPSDITSSDQSQEMNNGNLYNGNQHSQPNRQQQQQQQHKPPPPPPPPPGQQQQNGDNPLKNILQKKHMKILPVPPPHPPPPPPPPSSDRSIGKAVLRFIDIG